MTKRSFIKNMLNHYLLLCLLIFSSLSFAQEELSISALYFPYYNVQADIDPDELNGGQQFHHDLEQGEGAGFRIGLLQKGFQSKVPVSLSYYRVKQREIETKDAVVSQALYLEVLPETELGSPDESIHSFGRIIAGIGVVKFDFVKNKSHEWGAASEIGGQVGLRIGKFLNVAVGVGYFLWGYPSETIGEGSYFNGEVNIVF
jgi:hypothetical protein